MSDSNPSALPPEDHQELVRRFEAGDRNPALLDALNHAAFNLFHAPWEKEPRRPRSRRIPMRDLTPLPIEEEDGSDFDCDVPDFGSQVTGPIPDPSLLAALTAQLEALGRRVFSDEQGHFRIEAGYDPVADCYATVALDLEPCMDLIYVRTWSDLPGGTGASERADTACARWNRRMARLKAVRETPKQAPEGAELRTTGEALLLASPCLASPDTFRSNLVLALEDVGVFWRFMRRCLRPPEA